MQKHDSAYSACEFTKSMCVIMKCNMQYLYYQGWHIDGILRDVEEGVFESLPPL